MSLLTRNELLDALDAKGPEQLFLDPLLDREQQVGAVGIDLRLGYDFLVSIMTRRPSVNLGAQAGQKRSIASYFQETRRDLGDQFVVYPNQVVLGTSLEYLAVPETLFAKVSSRSSVNRLGVHISGHTQPGFRGCVPFELFNHGHTPIELVVGGRIAELRVYRVDARQAYLNSRRKYVADVRPSVSRADEDAELTRLRRCAEFRDRS